ncbi:MAG: peptidase T [Butyrivibrio sp.]
MKAYERFLKYAGMDTCSSEESKSCPSTDKQFLLAQVLVNEMKEMGIADAFVDEHCYVYGTVPASKGRENEKKIGLISHMDTAPAFSGTGVSPRIVQNYDGGDIILNSEKNIVLSVKMFPELASYAGQDIIVTDGLTLLGADDKAGIAEILAGVERLLENNLSNPGKCIAFTPHEEIGRGADLFDVKGFGADYAYTVDGGALGELEYENFNAASAVVKVHGNCIHPGEGKNKMKNASLIAMEFNGMLPPAEIPAHTENYEGFYHLLSVQGDEENATMEYIIRDHDMDKFRQKKAMIITIRDFLNQKYGSGTVETKVEDSYYNMKEKILPHMEIIDRAREAFAENGIQSLTVPIRGGTDGARLSYMGLPCPNLCTGGHNFHGKYEYIPVDSMEKMTDVLVSLITARK